MKRLLSLSLFVACIVNAEIANTHVFNANQKLHNFVINFLNSSPTTYNTREMWEQLHTILEQKATFQEANLNVNIKHDSGVTMLYCAVRQNMPGLARSLLAQNADPNIPENSLLNYPLHAAVDNANNDIIKLLHLFDANINAFNLEHQTPLLRAVLKQHTTTVATLLACGADRTIKDRYGKRPIDYAKARKYTEIEALLN